MWQTGGGAKHSTRRGGPSLTEEEKMQIQCSVNYFKQSLSDKG